MKRYSDGNMGTPQKRSRGGPNDIDVKILIPSKVAGSIIGKGGKNISKLRSDFNSSVTVPDCPGPERILTVTAELDNALKVLEDVVPNLEDYVGGRGSGGEVDIRMLVHQSQAGCIIGKGGLKVKELREKTGARIKIYTNCCPQSTDRVVQITGRGQTCTDCIREIVELLKGAPVKGIDNPYDPHNYDDFYSDEYGGYGVGGGGGDRGGPPMMGNRGDMGPRGGGGGRFGGGPRGGDMPPRGSMGGAPPRGGYGGGGGYGGNGMGMNDMPPMGMGGGGPMGGSGPMSGGMDNGNGGGLGGACNSTQVTIPKDLAGAIIGKAGARIRKIRSDSGAGITIDEAPPNSNDRVITITGLPSQIQMAQYLLQQSVHENTSQGGGRY